MLWEKLTKRCEIQKTVVPNLAEQEMLIFYMGTFTDRKIKSILQMLLSKMDTAMW